MTSSITPAEALELVKDLAPAKFDETVEIAVRLGVDPRKADQMVRGTVALPSGTGKDVRVAVFAAGEAAAEARAAGADIVGADDLAAEVEKGMLDFDVAIATPDLMPMVGQLGRVLGPRGLMPNPKTGTVTTDVGQGRHRVQGRQGRVPHRPLRQRARADRQGQLPTEALLDELPAPCSTSCSGPSRPRPRAATCARSPCRRRWAPASRSMPPTATRGRQGRSLSEKPSDDELAAVAPPPFWSRFGLRGPVIVLAWVGRNAKRMLVAALGFTVLGAGVALLALPGPGLVVIIVGLAILATEFAWAERALDKTLGKASQAAGAVTGNTAGRVLLALSGCALVAAGIVVLMANTFDGWESAGVGLIVAGTAGLATLLPPIQAWIMREQAKRDAKPRVTRLVVSAGQPLD